MECLVAHRAPIARAAPVAVAPLALVGGLADAPRETSEETARLHANVPSRGLLLRPGRGRRRWRTAQIRNAFDQVLPLRVTRGQTHPHPLAPIVSWAKLPRL